MQIRDCVVLRFADNILWIRETPCPVAYKELQYFLNQCSFSELTAKCVNLYDNVIVKKKSSWYRAKVLEVHLTSNVSYTVWLLDTAQKYATNIIYKGLERIFDAPFFVFPVVIDDIILNRSSSEETVKFLSSLTGCVVKLKETRKFHNIILGDIIFEDSTTLKEVLLTSGAAKVAVSKNIDSYVLRVCSDIINIMENNFNQKQPNRIVVEEDDTSDEEFFSCNSSLASSSGNLSFSSSVNDVPFEASIYDSTWLDLNSNDEYLAWSKRYIHEELNFLSSRIVVKGKGTRFLPAIHLKDLELESNILFAISNNMKFHHTDILRPIQSVAIPAILKKNNVVIIGPPQSTKTYSYVAPLVHFLHQSPLPPSVEPKVIIVCSSLVNVQKIQSFVRSLSSLQPNFNVIALHGGGAEEKNYNNLSTRCHMLITTLHSLMRVLEFKFFFKSLLNSVEHFVIDDANRLTEDPFYSKLCSLLQFLGEQRDMNTTQMICCAEKITQRVEGLIRFCAKRDFYLISNSLLETALFFKVNMRLHFTSEEQRLNEFKSMMSPFVGEKNVIIFCCNEREAELLHEAYDHKALLAHDHMFSKPNFSNLKDCWTYQISRKMKPFLICTDKIFDDISVTDADVIGHYSLPIENKTFFECRFSAFNDSYMNIFENGKTRVDEPSDLHSIILMDNDNYQLPDVIEWITRVGVKVPDICFDWIKKIRRERELAKIPYDICENLISLGACPIARNCRFRHAFDSNYDRINENCHYGKQVVVELITVHTGISFSARIIGYVQSDGTCKENPNFYNDISLKLSNHFVLSDKRSWLYQGTVKVGDLCGYENEAGLVSRCRVVAITRTYPNNIPKTVELHLIDIGKSIVNYPVKSLYALPDDLKEFPPQVTKVYLSGLAPCDCDTNWPIGSCKVLVKAAERLLQPNEMWRGTVLFSINNNLIIDNLWLSRFECGISFNDADIKKRLLDDNLAVENSGHLTGINVLLAECGAEPIEPLSSVSNKETENVALDEAEPATMEKIVAQPTPQWAFLMDLKDNCATVILMCADSAGRLFLRQSKFSDLLKQLEKDIEKETSNESPDIVLRSVNEGSFVLAFYDSEQKWIRVRIEKIVDDLITVFSVDSGHIFDVDRSQLRPLSNQLMTTLPFQVIECCMHSKKEIEAYSDELICDIYEVVGSDPIVVKIVQSNLSPTLTGGKKYSIILKKPNGDSLNDFILGYDTENEYDGDNDDDNDESDMEAAAETDRKLNATLAENIHLNGSHNNINLVNILNHIHWEENPDEEEPLFDNEGNLIFARPENLPGEPLYENDDDPPENNVPPVVNNESGSSSSSSIKAPIKQQHSDDDFRVKHMTENEVEYQYKSFSFIEKKYLTPKIHWYETDDEIFLKVDVKNAENYHMKAEIKQLSLSLRVGDKIYRSNLHLFGGIYPNLSEVEIKGLNVVVKLKKLCPWPWPRLHNSPSKFIYRDYDQFQDNYDNELDDYECNIYQEDSDGDDAYDTEEGICSDDFCPSSEEEEGVM